jgi:hypothetical protein
MTGSTVPGDKNRSNFVPRGTKAEILREDACGAIHVLSADRNTGMPMTAQGEFDVSPLVDDRLAADGVFRPGLNL